MNKINQLLFTSTEEQYNAENIINGTKKKQSEHDLDKQPKKRNFIRLLLVLMVFLAIPLVGIITNQVTTFDDAVVQKEDGTYALSPARQAKLDRELEQFDNAEQYALIARTNGWYICHSCMETDSIYLLVGEIWKYGITTKGQWGRYPNGLPDQKLEYFTEFEGDLLACLKREKTQIYNYIHLPENLKRTNPLVRPPGNKQDN